MARAGLRKEAPRLQGNPDVKRPGADTHRNQQRSPAAEMALEGICGHGNMTRMDQQFGNRPVIDMTPEGEFRGPTPRRASPMDKILGRVTGVAALVALVAGGIVVAGLAIAFFAIALPVAVLAGLIAFGSLWWRMRRAGQQGRGFMHVMRR
jgi:hypothetical protein